MYESWGGVRQDCMRLEGVRETGIYVEGMRVCERQTCMRHEGLRDRDV